MKSYIERELTPNVLLLCIGKVLVSILGNTEFIIICSRFIMTGFVFLLLKFLNKSVVLNTILYTLMVNHSKCLPRTLQKKLYIYICVCVCVCPTWCHLQLFYLINLYRFRAFLAHPQEIQYCLVSRYGKRKCALWCPVVWCGWSIHGTGWVYGKRKCALWWHHNTHFLLP
jgi:hypothetical protein